MNLSASKIELDDTDGVHDDGNIINENRDERYYRLSITIAINFYYHLLKLEISLSFDKKYFARNHFRFVIFSLF